MTVDATMREVGLANLRRARSSADRRVDLLKGLPAIADRAASVAEECTTVFEVMLRPRLAGCSQQELFDDLLDRRVGIRSVWSGGVDYRPPRGRAAGHDGRIVEQIPVERLLIFDRTTAIVAVPGVSAAAAALYIRSASLVQPYARAFDVSHSRALADDPTAADALTSRQRAVLMLLRDGRRDTEIATALGVTDRTVRRHLRELHRLSHTRTRFQLGQWWAYQERL